MAEAEYGLSGGRKKKFFLQIWEEYNKHPPSIQPPQIELGTKVPLQIWIPEKVFTDFSEMSFNKFGCIQGSKSHLFLKIFKNHTSRHLS